MLDYIVVGFGLSGLSFIEQLEKNDKSFLVFEDSSQKSSRVAGGLYNPVILKRFTAAWNAKKQLQKAIPFYKNVQTKLNEQLVLELPVLRRFNSVEEQNAWFEACTKPILEDFLDQELMYNSNEGLDIPFHYGRVHHTGRIDIKNMLSCYLNYLDKKDCLVNESFDHEQLIITDNFVSYKGQEAKNILFSEGFGVQNNPFFKYLPLVGNKGEYLVISSPKLQLNEAVKSSIFIIPLGNNRYKIGATYNNQDTTSGVTLEAKEELLRKLERFLKVPYEIIDHVAGIRPTVRDRRPLVGTHPKHKKLHVLNGLGSRGILIGPTVAENLYDAIENDTALDKEIDIKRYDNFFSLL
ncbi:FAD-binding oxidoreductase [Aquimarina sp. AU474]|uniref:NAD(P)/FAD-dependent oxidoreductase n=1 Tax=Aquimarina sp. AU474 TaxID=2108529 RepID=UPI000D6958C6|nr:FAD-dependent oxidoreductase [Aquimarina sp. AU474]